MRLVRTIPELDALLRESSGRVLVPTMGALHAGHAALVHRGTSLAKERNLLGGCLVTIFVNPTQFNESADFQRYPKTLDADLALCEANGAAAVFAPDVETIYPASNPTPTPPLPAQATTPLLEDRLRPGHFAGVCQVVLRLFQLAKPSAAIFGEKDWQQLQVIRAMTLQQRLPIEIIPGATIREHDGLAMSSRNRFLSPEDRQRALALSQALRLASAEPTPAAAEARMAATLAHANITPDYAVVRDAETLFAPTPSRPMRAIIAGRLGSVRLLDNAPWPA